jgi:dipeptidase E
MQLYLSSYHLGDHPESLAELFSNKKVALISNAVDYSTDQERNNLTQGQELRDLRSIGLNPTELDLREFFGQPERLSSELAQFGGIWIRGGNCFVLRRAMRYSGLDTLILAQTNNPNFVYAGYSAGACVAGPTLRGLELVDDEVITPPQYNPEIIWEGLNVVPFSIAPHYKSDHPESDDIDRVVEFFERNEMPYKALRDGEVYLGSISS